MSQNELKMGRLDACTLVFSPHRLSAPDATKAACCNSRAQGGCSGGHRRAAALLRGNPWTPTTTQEPYRFTSNPMCVITLTSFINIMSTGQYCSPHTWDSRVRRGGGVHGVSLLPANAERDLYPNLSEKRWSKDAGQTTSGSERWIMRAVT